MDYELIDCGDGYKVERFGKYVLARPEPQALWHLSKPLEYWAQHADAFFERKKGEIISNKEDSGSWTKKDAMPNSWTMSCGQFGKTDLKAKLSLTSFKHVGIFPEQFPNWQFIFENISQNDYAFPMLNLFAYTGMASLAGAAAGSQVVHVDSVKQVINWSNENRMLSNIAPSISWIVEDALKYIKREINRNKKYSAIILDPPAYGRGANGEKWILEKELFDLLLLCKKLLDDKNSFLIINLYSMNISPVLLENILREAGLWSDKSYVFEQTIPYQKDRKLPFGICGRVIF
jgi:23S rRNA (cytosine1962-C5)-methyltransferase